MGRKLTARGRHSLGEMQVAEKTENTGEPIVIKKYANRRLYNTAKSTYVTLDHLAQMVRDGQDFVVNDAKSGDDITRGVLAQIIFEEEAKGQSLADQLIDIVEAFWAGAPRNVIM